MFIEILESRRLLASSTPFSGTPVSLPGTIQAENFDNGGEGVAYHSPSSVNLGGQYRSTGVSIEATGDAGGGYDVGWTHAGEWLGYSVNAPTAGNYDLAVRVADAAQGGNFHVEVDGVNVSGTMTVPNTGAWQSYVTLSKTAIPIGAGNHFVKLVMDSEGSYGFVGNFNWMQFTASPVGGASGPYGGTPWGAPGTIEAENFDNGGEGVAYHSGSSVNLGGAYRAGGVSIQSTSDAGGGYNVGWTHAGDFLTYTMNVPIAGKYNLDARVASGGAGGTFHVEFGANGSFADKTGAMVIPDTGGWQNYTTVTKSGIDLPAGTYVMKVVCDTNGQYGFVGNFNWFRLTAAAVTPVESARNVLFFGNSFTAYNDLPSIVADIAVADGHVRPNVFSQTTFGWTLSDHLNKLAADGANNIIVHSLPVGGSWDDVVVQDLSTRPASVTAAPVSGDPSGFRADAAALFKKVHDQSPSAKDVLFETWARGPANPFYPGSYPNPNAMQTDVLAQYDGAAWDANHAYGASTAVAAHVGEAWRRENFAADLYNGPDEYHPSAKGSVLAGLVIYRAIYHDDTADVPAAKVTAFLAAHGLTPADWGTLTGVADSIG